jgi:hypothetical protein
MSSGNAVFTPIPEIQIQENGKHQEVSTGRISPKGPSVQRAMTSKEINMKSKKNIERALKITDKEFNALSPSEQKAYENWLRDLLRSWQESSMREKMGLRGGKSRKNRSNKSKRGKKTLRKH